MSFVRLGTDGSEVYIYDDVDDGPVCRWCAFTERLPDYTPDEIDPEIWRRRWAPDFATRDLDEMLAHVAKHRDAGHVVPDWVEDVLREEWDADDR
jgi:hypothetical protein